ncbi:hypothetical protein Hanom_Chr01g00014461 [Helianthus anomalus]
MVKIQNWKSKISKLKNLRKSIGHLHHSGNHISHVGNKSIISHLRNRISIIRMNN